MTNYPGPQNFLPGTFFRKVGLFQRVPQNVAKEYLLHNFMISLFRK